jgi:hypothetical protein
MVTRLWHDVHVRIIMQRLALLIPALLLLGSFDQGNQAHIAWHPDRLLTWSDFRGTNPTPTTGVDAISHCVLYPSYSFDKQGVRYVVETRFVPSKSWARNKEGGSDQLLRHEQGHFDLTEYYARQFRLVLSRSTLTPENVGKRMQVLTDSIMSICDARHDLYDSETQLGRNQEAWIQLINAIG